MTTAQVPPQLPVINPESVPTATVADGKLVVRRLLAVFGFIAAIVFVLVFALTRLFSVANAPIGSAAVTVLGIILGLILPIAGFAISSNWLFAATAESRKNLRRFVGIMLVAELLCVDAIGPWIVAVKSVALLAVVLVTLKHLLALRRFVAAHPRTE
jgi:hypothetical protein